MDSKDRLESAGPLKIATIANIFPNFPPLPHEFSKSPKRIAGVGDEEYAGAGDSRR
jgi:hypothetical protein